MAEAILNKRGAGNSAPTAPAASPRATCILKRCGCCKVLATTRPAFARSRGTNLPSPARPSLDFVFTVCDNAAGETCPVWPGQPMTAHWGVPDPAEATGTPAEIALAFKDAYRMLNQRIGIFTALADALARSTDAAKQLKEIGRMDEMPSSRLDALTGAAPRLPNCWARRSCSPQWSARASWPQGSPAGTARWRCSATRCRPAPS